MTQRRIAFTLVAAVVAVCTIVPARPRAQAASVPTRLSDRDFWTFITSSSEESGTFHSENLVSNEIKFQQILPQLTQMAAPGRPYVGVGSEQNFTYIDAVKPNIAFIVDLRRGNLDLHLLYKAMFELSADRAEFVSRLFSRPKPAGLGPSSTASEIFAAFSRVAPSRALYDENLRTFEAHLSTKHGFALSDGDREGMSFVYNSWFEGGPELRYQLTTGQGAQSGRGGARGGGFNGGRAGGGPGGPGGMPTYADLMAATDGKGQARSYLATEENFRFMKDLETRNLVVPVVGNFAGPKALRAVATYLKQQKQTVSVFYLSNVEQYLQQDGIWNTFCANAATLPVDASSVFIRSQRGGTGFELSLVPIAPEVAACRRF